MLTLSVAPGDFWPQDWNGTASANRLPSVTSSSAMAFPAYFAGVRAISEDIAKIPLIVYRRKSDDSRERAMDVPLYRVLHDVSNPEMTAFIFRETLQAHLLSWGNGYAEIQRNGNDDVVALWPLRPDRMIVRRNDIGNREYRYTMPGGDVTVLPARRVFHLRGLGFDGLIGYSIVTILRRSIALGLAAEEYSERVFLNDGRPGAVLKTPKGFPDTAMKNLRESWAENHEGLTNAQRTAILEDGVDLTTIGFPPSDTRFIETLKASKRDIATGLRIPPHKIGDLENATFSNIEQQALEYVGDGLGGWFARWEGQVSMDLIPAPDLYAEFLPDALLKTDTLSRYQSHTLGINGGWLSPNDILRMENRPLLPPEIGDVYRMPMNVTVVSPDGTTTRTDLTTVPKTPAVPPPPEVPVP